MRTHVFWRETAVNKNDLLLRNWEQSLMNHFWNTYLLLPTPVADPRQSSCSWCILVQVVNIVNIVLKSSMATKLYRIVGTSKTSLNRLPWSEQWRQPFWVLTRGFQWICLGQRYNLNILGTNSKSVTCSPPTMFHL